MAPLHDNHAYSMIAAACHVGQSTGGCKRHDCGHGRSRVCAHHTNRCDGHQAECGSLQLARRNCPCREPTRESMQTYTTPFLVLKEAAGRPANLFWEIWLQPSPCVERLSPESKQSTDRSWQAEPCWYPFARILAAIEDIAHFLALQPL